MMVLPHLGPAEVDLTIVLEHHLYAHDTFTQGYLAANVYLCLYPKPFVESAVRQQRLTHADIFNALVRIEMDSHLHNGRVYGGGLFKMEPKELESIDAGPINELLQGELDQPLLWPPSAWCESG